MTSLNKGLLLLFAAACVLAWPLAAFAQDAPVIHAPQPEYEFEPVSEGAKVNHSFVLQNKGNSTLVIERIHTSCGCTAASFTREIPAGGEGTIDVVFDTTGYGGREAGQVIGVFSNDPAQTELHLSITGQVKPFASVEPRYLQLVGPVGASLSGKAAVTPLEEFVVTGIRAEPEQMVEANFEEIVREGKTSYLVTVKSIQNQPGRHYVMVHLATDRQSRPEIAIPVLIVIR